MSKKLLWLFAALAATLALVAAGCGSDDDEEGAGDTAASETSTGGAAAEAISVGLVTDIGGLNDRGFNELANTGLEQAEEEFGVEGRVLESKSDADYIPNLSTLAEEGSNLIVTNGFLMGESTHAAAEQFPDTNFAIIDFAYGGEGCEKTKSCELPNLQGLLFREQEVGYLAGYMAAKMSKTGTISSVGGQKIPPVDRFIAGYQAGAKAANPDIKVLNGYSQEFVDPAPCKEIALDQISKGSDVVFQVAGGCGLGALDAAKEKGVWGIGVDKDQAFLGRPHPDQRRQARRRRREVDDRGRGERRVRGRRRLRVHARERRRRSRRDEQRGAAGDPRRDRGAEADDHRRGHRRSRTR